MEHDAAYGSEGAKGGRRPQARVALALLEGLRDMDRPVEVLDDEDVTLTMPRRFGLSGVVDAQIRRYEREARHGRRIPAAEVDDLIRLATRRDDAQELFTRVGRSLTAADGAPAWRKAFPERVVLPWARQRVRRRLKSLFGERIVSAARGSFALEGTSDLFISADPGGDACALVTGLSQAVLDAYAPGAGEVAHSSCRARGDGRCLWALQR
jgi:hypothetical protein